MLHKKMKEIWRTNLWNDSTKFSRDFLPAKEENRWEKQKILQQKRERKKQSLINSAEKKNKRKIRIRRKMTWKWQNKNKGNPAFFPAFILCLYDYVPIFLSRISQNLGRTEEMAKIGQICCSFLWLPSQKLYFRLSNAETTTKGKI